MTWNAERAAIEGRFHAQWATTTPVSWDNAPFTPPAGAAWVRLTILNGESFNAALGPTSIRNPGIISVQVFTPENTGTGTARALAESAAAIFRNARFAGIRCRAASISRAPPGDGWYQINVTVPFERDEFL